MESLIRHRANVNVSFTVGARALDCRLGAPAAGPGHAHLRARPPALRDIASHPLRVAQASGPTPLHAAVEGRRAEAVELLLQCSANVSARGAGQEPLHIAAALIGAPFEPLLRAGAPVESRDAVSLRRMRCLP
jgi:hypothetical protein